MDLIDFLQPIKREKIRLEEDEYAQLKQWLFNQFEKVGKANYFIKHLNEIDYAIEDESACAGGSTHFADVLRVAGIESNAKNITSFILEMSGCKVSQVHELNYYDAADYYESMEGRFMEKEEFDTERKAIEEFYEKGLLTICESESVELLKSLTNLYKERGMKVETISEYIILIDEYAIGHEYLFEIEDDTEGIELIWTDMDGPNFELYLNETQYLGFSEMEEQYNFFDVREFLGICIENGVLEDKESTFDFSINRAPDLHVNAFFKTISKNLEKTKEVIF